MAKKIFLTFLFVCTFGAIYGYIELQHPRFGIEPSGERLARMEQTPTFKDGQFRNLMADPAPETLEKEPFLTRMYDIHFAKGGARTPSEPIPTLKADLKNLAIDENVIIPFGHFSCFIQINGVKMLLDPVFADYAAPFSFLNRAFEGTVVYTAEDMPYVDYILITHNHYDHLDYDAMLYMLENLEEDPRFGKIIVPLGLGAYFEHWGFPTDVLLEGYWYESFSLKNNLEINFVPARHYSSRLFDSNTTLWVGYAITAPDMKIFISGDTGYGEHFKQIVERLGSFDIGILDVGQFNAKGWPHIHLLPEHAAMAAEELGLKRVIPFHNSKFAIALHDWKDPLELITEASIGKSYNLLTPMIGEIIDLDNEEQVFSQWWKDIE